MPRNNLIIAKYRRDTTANWSTANPVLADREIAMEWTGVRWLIKMGDGTTPWSSLPYAFTAAISAAASALPAGSNPTAALNWTNGVLSLGIPAGPTGNPGGAGVKGDKGDAGDRGLQGLTGPSGTTILGSLASAFAYTSSTTETTAFSTTIPANSLGTSTALVRMMARGYITQTSVLGLAVAPSFTIRVKYGGQTLVAMSGVALRLAVLDNSAAFELEVDLFMRGGSAQQQSIYSKIHQAAAAGPFMLSTEGGVIMRRADLTVDSTQAQSLLLTAQSTLAIATTTLVLEQVRLIRFG